MSKFSIRHAHSHGTPSAHQSPISPVGDSRSTTEAMAGPSSFNVLGPPQESQLDTGEHAFPALPPTWDPPVTYRASSSSFSRPSEEPAEPGALGSPTALDDYDRDAHHYGSIGPDASAHAPNFVSNAQTPPAILPLPLYPPFRPFAIPFAAPILHWSFSIYDRGLMYPQALSTPTLNWPSVRCLCGSVLQLQVASRAPYTPAWCSYIHHIANGVLSLPTLMLWIFREPNQSMLVTRWEPSADGFSSTTHCPFCFRVVHVQWEFNV